MNMDNRFVTIQELWIFPLLVWHG